MTRGIVRSAAGFLGVIATVGIAAASPLDGTADVHAGAHVNAHVDDDAEARRLFRRAELSFTLGKFAEALADYQSAYQAKPLPGFLFNIAQCYRNMSDYERARFFFRRYLAIDPHVSNRRRVDDLIAEMTKQIEAQSGPMAPTAAVAPGTAPVTSPPPAPAPPLAEPVATAAPAPALLSPTSGASEGATVVVTTAPPPARPARTMWRRWWFWTGVGAVVAGGAVAAVVLTRPSTQTPGSLPPIDGR
jgi:Tetratricopeptide repeat